MRWAGKVLKKTYFRLRQMKYDTFYSKIHAKITDSKQFHIKLFELFEIYEIKESIVSRDALVLFIAAVSSCFFSLSFCFLELIQLKINYEFTVMANFTSLKRERERKKMQYRQITRRKKKEILEH